jgi:hypothetical protein
MLSEPFGMGVPIMLAPVGTCTLAELAAAPPGRDEERASAAAVDVLLPLAAVAFGLTALGIVLQLTRGRHRIVNFQEVRSIERRRLAPAQSFRLPLAGQLLCFHHLSRGHVGRDQVPRKSRGSIPSGRCQVEPHVCIAIVLRRATLRRNNAM